MLSLKKVVTTWLWFPYSTKLRRIMFPEEYAPTFKARLWLMLDMALLVVNVLRLVVLCVHLQNEAWFGWINYDVAYRFLVYLNFIDTNLILLVLLFIMFDLYFYYFLTTYGKTGRPPELRCHRQLNFDNPKAMLEENRQLFARFDKISVRNTLELFGIIWKLFRKDENLLGRIRFRARLSTFPMLTKENRVNQFLIYLGAEMLILMNVAIHPLIAVVIVYVTMTEVIHVRYALAITWYDWLVVLQTGYSLYFYCYIMVEIGFLLACMSMTSASAITFYYGQLNRFIRKFAQQTRATKIRPAIINYQLFAFYREHKRMSQLVNWISDHLQTLFCVAILTNIPVNVHCFHVLFLGRHKFNVSHIFFLNTFCFQLIISVIILLPAAFNSTAAHRAGKYMVPLQPKITKLRLKLKWNHYHEIVHDSRHTIAYKASLFGRLTVFTIVQFAFFYIEAIIFAFSYVH